VIDITVEGLDESKAVIIISERNKEISEAIVDRLGRGLTFLDAKGAYRKLLVTISGVEVTGKRYQKKSIH
jgi:uncharacterized membrane-anchored protein YitT (DUF2179 family)